MQPGEGWRAADGQAQRGNLYGGWNQGWDRHKSFVMRNRGRDRERRQSISGFGSRKDTERRKGFRRKEEGRLIKPPRQTCALNVEWQPPASTRQRRQVGYGS